MASYQETEEEKKVREERERLAAQQQALKNRTITETASNSSSNSSTSGTSTTDSNSSSSTTGSSTSTSYLQRPDSEDDRQQLNNRLNEIARANNYGGYDPNTGQLKEGKTFVSDVIGVDPNIMRQRRLDEAELNRQKAKNSAFFNALSVLGDMITTAAGGNVERREADKTGKEAAERNQSLAREQDAEDKDNATKLNKRRADTMALINKTIDDYNNTYGRRVNEGNSKQSSTGNQHSTTNQSSQSHTSQNAHQRTTSETIFDEDYINARYNKGGGVKGSGKSGNKVLKIPYTDNNGKPQSYEIYVDTPKYKAMGRYVSAALNNLTSQDKKNVYKVLADNGINPKSDGTYNTDDILSSGVIFDNPNIRNEFIKEILNAPELTEEGKTYLINQMRTYPVDLSEPVKEGWLKRMWNHIFGDDEQETIEPQQPSNNGWTPSATEQNQRKNKYTDLP